VVFGGFVEVALVKHEVRLLRFIGVCSDMVRHGDGSLLLRKLNSKDSIAALYAHGGVETCPDRTYLTITIAGLQGGD
jgi:hypothetical protein